MVERRGSWEHVRPSQIKAARTVHGEFVHATLDPNERWTVCGKRVGRLMQNVFDSHSHRACGNCRRMVEAARNTTEQEAG